MVEGGASDLHLSAGSQPSIRVDGLLEPMTDLPVLNQQRMESLLYSVLTPDQLDRLQQARNLDLSYSVPGRSRFRGNLLWQRGTLGAVFRAIPARPLTLDELGMPPNLKEVALKPRGLVLVTGPTGSGKSTTLAAMIDFINENVKHHIVTIEDPIEYLHKNKKCIVRQREVGSDVATFGEALKYVLRQDPDVILVGELRDLETVSLAVSAAETGHLVFGTLHTLSAATTVERIIDVFPPVQQQQIRLQLAGNLEAVMCQTLLPLASGRGRTHAMEIMLGTPAVRSLIREGTTHQLIGVIETSGRVGMQSLNQSLARLVRGGDRRRGHPPRRVAGRAACHVEDEEMTTFTELGLPEALVAALEYSAPTAIQAAAIPHLRAGSDVIGQAQTGTGKTAAYALPMVERVAGGGVAGLVLTPTRELATQVARAVTRYGKGLGVHAIAVYGGQSYSYQRKRLAGGPQVVVGTPGRTLDLVKRGDLDFSGVRCVVLDEADEMLRLGFIDDVEAILALTPGERQTALFSATIPNPVRRLAERYMRDPVPVEDRASTRTVEGVTQRFYVVSEPSKVAALSRLLEVEEVRSALIFVRMRARAADLADMLISRGFSAEALHGDLSQDARESVLRRFRREQISFLVATDVAARGLDIGSVSHVFNFDLAEKPEDYVHRIGRTARAGSAGEAISLVTPPELRRVAEISQYTRSPLRRAVLPTVAEVHARRDYRFAQRLEKIAGEADLLAARAFVEAQVAGGWDPVRLAAAAVHLSRAAEAHRPDEEVREVFEASRKAPRGERDAKGHEAGMVRLVLSLGRAHGIKVADVVAGISRVGGVPGSVLGVVKLGRYRTTVDVAEGSVAQILRRVRSGLNLRGHVGNLTRER